MIISNKDGEPGFTLIEILVVIATLTILITVFFPALAKQRSKKLRIDCVNNVREVGLAFRLWYGNSADWYPMVVSTNDGGSKEFVNTAEVFRHFQCLSNELGGLPKTLCCPAHKERLPASSFSKLSNTNISYFVGSDSSSDISIPILLGDRNITNGFAPKNGMLELTTNQLIGWTKEIHTFQGNVALDDGTAWQVSNARFKNDILAKTGLATNRIAVP